MQRMSVFLSFALLGCTSDVGNTRLADVDLSDMRVVQRLKSQMDPEERQAFATYMVEHYVSSEKFCGRPLVGAQGQKPATIRDAIEMTRFRQRQDYAAIPDDSGIREEPIVRQWDDLISRRDLLIDRQTLLSAENGKSARDNRELKSIRDNIADLDRQLLDLRSRYLAAGVP